MSLNTSLSGVPAGLEISHFFYPPENHTAFQVIAESQGFVLIGLSTVATLPDVLLTCSTWFNIKPSMSSDKIMEGLLGDIAFNETTFWASVTFTNGSLAIPNMNQVFCPTIIAMNRSLTPAMSQKYNVDNIIDFITNHAPSELSNCPTVTAIDPAVTPLPVIAIYPSRADLQSQGFVAGITQTVNGLNIRKAKTPLFIAGYHRNGFWVRANDMPSLATMLTTDLAKADTQQPVLDQLVSALLTSRTTTPFLMWQTLKGITTLSNENMLDMVINPDKYIALNTFINPVYTTEPLSQQVSRSVEEIQQYLLDNQSTLGFGVTTTAPL